MRHMALQVSTRKTLHRGQSRCSIGKVSLSYRRANGQLAGPVQSGRPPRSRPVSGRALASERQMVVRWQPIVTHPMERRAVLRPKLRLEIRSLSDLKFLFLERFFVFKQCYADAEVLSASGGGDTLLVMYYRNVVPESRERVWEDLRVLNFRNPFLSQPYYLRSVNPENSIQK